VDDDNTSSSDDNTLTEKLGAVSTGDTSNIFFWIMLATGAMVATALVVWSRKKSSN